MPAKPEVFIIESLRLKEEKRRFQEGSILSGTLRLDGKKRTKYFYIRTKRELGKIIKRFGNSNCLYLHISCHADANGMWTTFDYIPYTELGKLLRPHLNGKRVFVSACKMATRKLAKEILTGTKCLSLTGPEKKIGFGDAAVFWISFYHLMFNDDEGKMNDKDLKNTVKKLSAVFGESINHFVKDGSSSKGFKRVLR